MKNKDTVIYVTLFSVVVIIIALIFSYWLIKLMCDSTPHKKIIIKAGGKYHYVDDFITSGDAIIFEEDGKVYTIYTDENFEISHNLYYNLKGDKE